METVTKNRIVLEQSLNVRKAIAFTLRNTRFAGIDCVDEIAQCAYEKLLTRALDRFDSKRGDLAGFVYGVARNETLDYVKRACRSKPHVGISDDYITNECDEENTLECIMLKRAMACLDKQEKRLADAIATGLPAKSLDPMGCRVTGHRKKKAILGKLRERMV